jgi:putative adhesin
MTIRATRLLLLALALTPGCAGRPSSSDTRALGGCPSGTAAGGLFDNAICVCQAFRQSGHLVTHAEPGGSASIGVNGRSEAADGSRVEGSWAAGGDFVVSGDVTIRDDLVARGSLDGAGVLHVGRDVAVAGDVRMTGNMAVAGALVHKAAAADPCGCDPSTLFDVSGAVADARVHNDNAARGVSTGLLAGGAPATLSLTAGRYYFGGVTTLGQTQLVVDGAVSLFIDGSLDLVGDDQITVQPGATLDLYVSGIVGQSGRVRSTGNPASAFRLFVGGERAILMASGEQAWSGLVYAPTAWVTIAGRTNIAGAIFAGSLDHSGDLDVYYSAPTVPAPQTCPGDGNFGDGSGGGGSGGGGSGGGGGAGPIL